MFSFKKRRKSSREANGRQSWQRQRSKSMTEDAAIMIRDKDAPSTSRMQRRTTSIQSRGFYILAETVVVDELLELSCEDFRSSFKEAETVEVRRHPDMLILAEIVQAVEQTEDSVKEYLPEGWELLTTGRNTQKGNGYRGVAAWEPRHRCVVITHRNVQRTQDSWVDLQGVIKKKWMAQVTSAITFTHQVVNRISQMVGDDFEIFVTGHSLGGWLSQITTYTIQFCAPQSKHKSQSKQMFEFGCEKWKPHCVAFDPPGCKEMLDSLKQQLESGENPVDSLDELHITTFVSIPHLVNCWGTHFGRLIRVFPEEPKPGAASINTFINEFQKIKMINEKDQDKEKIVFKEIMDWPNLKARKELVIKVMSFMPGTLKEQYVKKLQTDLQKEAKNTENSLDYKRNLVPRNALTKSEKKFLDLYSIHFHLQEKLRKKTNDTFLDKCDEILLNLRFANDGGDYWVCEEPVRVEEYVPCIRKLLRDHPMYLLDLLTALNRSKMDVGFQFQKGIVPRYSSPGLKVCQCEDPHLTSVRIVDELEAHGHTVQLLKQTDLNSYQLLSLGHQNADLEISNVGLNAFVVVAEKKINPEQEKLIRDMKENNLIVVVSCTELSQLNTECGSPDSVIWLKNELEWEDLQVNTQNDIFNANILRFEGQIEKHSINDVTKARNPHDLKHLMTTDLLRRIVKVKRAKEELEIVLKKGELTTATAVEHIKRLLYRKVYQIDSDVVKSDDKNSLFVFIKQKSQSTKRELKASFSMNSINSESNMLAPNTEEDHISSWTEKLQMQVQTGTPRFEELMEQSQKELEESDRTVFYATADRSKREFEKFAKHQPNKNVFLIDSKGSDYYLSQFHGDISKFRQFLKPVRRKITEMDLLRKCNEKITIIAGSPGLGKTETLKHLNDELQLEYQHSWVAYLTLNDTKYTKVFKKFKNGKKSFKTTDVVTFIAEELLKLEGDSRQVFELCLRHDSETFLLFDGFDEISPAFENVVMEMLAALKETKVKRVFVTTRNHLLQKLEDHLALASFSLKEFTDENITTFIEKNCGDVRPEEVKTILSTKTFKDVFYNPLTLKMLMEVLQVNGEAKTIKDVLKNTSQLYNTFIEKKLDMHMEQIHFVLPVADVEILRNLKNQALKDLKKSALKMQLPEHPELQINSEEYTEEELYRAGVIEKTNESNRPTFIHHTFAEYFVAEHLADKLKQKTITVGTHALLMSEILVADRFKTIRRFLNDTLSDFHQTPNIAGDLSTVRDTKPGDFLLVALTEDNANLVNYFTNYTIQNEIVDLGKVIESTNARRDTAVHLACKCENYEFLENITARFPSVKNLVKKVNNTGATPIYCLLNKTDFDEAKSYARIRWLESVTQTVDQFISNETTRPSVHRAFYNGHLEVLNFLTKKYPETNFYEVKDDNGNNSLFHMLSNPRNNENVRRYVKLLMNTLDEKNNNGDTYAHVALYSGLFDLIDSLTSFLGRDFLAVKNKAGDTPIHSMMMNSDLDHEVRRDRLQWLKRESVHIDCNVKNEDGNTPIHIALMNGLFDEVDVLMSKHSKRRLLRAKNKNGDTPVHEIINLNMNHEERAAMLKWLDREFTNIDFDLRNKDGETLAHVAMRNQRWDVIGFIFSKYPDGKFLQEVEDSGKSPTHKGEASSGRERKHKKISIDENLKLSCRNFRSRMKTETKMAEVRTHPDTLTLGEMAHAAYKTQDEDSVKSHLPEGWELLTIAQNKDNGYHGLAAWHPAHRTIILSHSGAKDWSIGTDLKRVLKNKRTPQIGSAVTFTHEVVQEVSSVLDGDIEVFVTGHCLGGWLAQITTYTIQFCAPQPDHEAFLFDKENWKPHCVVFDPPGCRDMLEDLQKALEPNQDSWDSLRELDITSWLTMPNLVNCCNRHFGKLIRIFPPDTLNLTHYQIFKTILDKCKKDKDETDQLNDNKKEDQGKQSTKKITIREVMGWPKLSSSEITSKIVLSKKPISEKHDKKFQEDLEEYVRYSDDDPQFLEQVRNVVRRNVLTRTERTFLEDFSNLTKLRGNLMKKNCDTCTKKCEEMLLKYTMTDETLTCEDPVKVQEFVPCVRKLLRDNPTYLLDALTTLNREDMGAGLTYQKQIVPRPMSQVVCFQSEHPQLTSVRVLNEMEEREHKAQLLQQKELTSELLTSVTNCAMVILLEGPMTERECFLTKQLVSNKNMVLLVGKMENCLLTMSKCSNMKGLSWSTEECRGMKWKDLHVDTQNSILDVPVVLFQEQERELSIRDVTKVTNPNDLKDLMTTDLLLNIIYVKAGKRKFKLTLEGGAGSQKKLFEGFKHIERSLQKRVYEVDISIFNTDDKNNICIMSTRAPRISLQRRNPPFIEPNAFFVRTFSLNRIDDKFTSIPDSNQELFSDFDTQSSPSKPNDDEKSKNRLTFPYGESNNEFEKLRRSEPNKNLFLLDCEGNHCYLSKFHGNFAKCRSHMKRKHKQVVNEKDLLQEDEKMTIISGSSGLGKTDTLLYLCAQLQREHPSSWVIHVALSAPKYTQVWEKFKNGFKTKDVVRFIANDLLTFQEEATKMLEYCLRHESEVFLLFDGFDEISPAFDAVVMEMLVALKETNVKRVFVSSRAHLVHELEGKLTPTSYALTPFSDENINTYIEENCTDVQSEKVRKFLAANEFKDIFYNPLTLQMFVDLLNQEPRQRAETTNDEGMLKNVSQLYRSFVDKKLEAFIKRYVPPSGALDRISKTEKERAKVILKTLALKLLVPKSEVFELDTVDYEPEELYRTGLVERKGEEDKFIHQTLPEYFVAECVLEKLKQRTIPQVMHELLMNDILIHKRYETVRRFLNDMLDEIPETPQFVGDKKKLKAREQSFLHIGLTEDNSKIVHFFTDYVIATKTANLKREIHLPQIQPHFQGNTPIHLACIYGNYKFLAKIRQIFPSLMSSILTLTNDFGDTPVHKTMRKLNPAKCAERQKWIELEFENIDFTMQNNNGSTPAHIAMSNGFINVIVFLTSKFQDRSFLTIKDIYGNTPIHNMILNPELSADKQAEMLKWLKSEFTYIDWNTRNNEGMTFAHMAMYNGYYGVIDFLLSKFPNPSFLYVKNYIGNTPLHEMMDNPDLSPDKCAQRYHWLERELKNINWDVKNYDRWTPIHIALRNGLFEMIGSLISEMTNRSFLEVAKTNGYTPMHSFMTSPDPKVSNTPTDRLKWLERELTHVDFETKNKDFRCPSEPSIETVKKSPSASSLNRFSVVRVGKKAQRNSTLHALTDDGVEGSQTSAHVAFYNGSFNEIDDLISESPDREFLKTKNTKGDTPVHELMRNAELSAEKCKERLLWLERELNFIDLNLKNNEGKTIAHVATYHGLFDVIDFLISKFPDRQFLKVKNNIGDTPIHDMMWNPNLTAEKCVQRLQWLEREFHNIDFRMRSKDGRTLAHIAMYNGFFDVIDFINSKFPDWSLMRIKNNFGGTPLHDMLWNSGLSSKKCAERLLWLEREFHNIDFDKRSKDGRALAHIAMYNGFCDVVDFLIAKFPDRGFLKSKNSFGGTPVHDMMWKSDLCLEKCQQRLEWLKREFVYIDFNDKNDDGRTVAHMALRNGFFDIIDFMISEFPDRRFFLEKNNNGDTPIHDMLWMSDLSADKCKERLLWLQREFNPIYFTSKNKFERTPAHIAMYNGFFDVIDFLISKFPDGEFLRVRNQFGDTPIHDMMWNADLSVEKCQERVEWLKRNLSFIDVQMKSNDGRTPAHIAMYNGFFDVINILISKFNKDFLEDKDHIGGTPIHYMMLKQDLSPAKCEERLRWLESHNIDFLHKNRKGETPLHIAIRNGFFEVIDVFATDRNSFEVTDINGNSLSHFLFANPDLSFDKCAERMKWLESNFGKLDFWIENDYGTTPIHLCLFHGHFDVFKFLDSKFPERNIRSVKDYTNATPLHCMLMNDELSDAKHGLMMKWMEREFSDLDLCEEMSDGCTSVHIALFNGFFDVVQLLLTNQPSSPALKLKNQSGETPVHYMMLKSEVTDEHAAERVRFITHWLTLQDWCERDHDGVTPAHHALRNAQYDVASVFLSRFTDSSWLTQQDGEGNTPLHWMLDYADVSEETRVQRLDWLNTIGPHVDLTCVNSAGRTPGDVALCRRHYEVVDWLLTRQHHTECFTMVDMLTRYKTNTQYTAEYRNQ